MSGHVDHLEGVVADPQGHVVLERDHGRIGSVALEQCRFLRPEGADAGNVLVHVGVEYARANALVGDDRGVEKRVTGPVVAVGLGVDNVTQQPALLYFRLQPHGCAGFVGTVDHHDAIGRGHEAEVAATDVSLHPYIAGELFHLLSPVRLLSGKARRANTATIENACILHG